MYRARFILDANTIYDSLKRMVQDEGLAEENIEFASFQPAETTTPEDAEFMLYSARADRLGADDPERCKAAVQLALEGESAADTICLNEKLYEGGLHPHLRRRTRPSPRHPDLRRGDQLKVVQGFSLAAGGQAVLIASNSVVFSTFGEPESSPA